MLTIPAPQKTLQHLDALRFIASVGIIFHHSLEFFYKSEARAAAGRLQAGLAMFVDLFFVISGFVIAYVYSSRIDSARAYGEFLQRRVARLVPLHWLTLIISILIYAALYVIGMKGFNHQPSFRPACIAQTAFLVQSFMGCGDLTFNGQSWSISAEMVMYIFFPLFAYAGRKHKLMPLFLTFLAFGVVLDTNGTEVLTSNEAWTLQQPLYRSFPSFLLGVGLYYNRQALAKIPFAEAIFAVSLLLTIAMMTHAAPAWATLLGIYVVAISAIAADENSLVSGLVEKIAPLGQFTYSMYMLHGLLILIIMNALGDKLLHLSLLPMIALAVICYTSIGVVSYFSLKYFETPARRKIDNVPLF